jgi:hypothetical protein
MPVLNAALARWPAGPRRAPPGADCGGESHA